MYTHASLRVTREKARECERGRSRGQVSCRKQSNQEQSNQARSSQEQGTQSHPTATRSYPRPRCPHAAPPSAQATRGSSPQQRGSTERQLHRLRTHGLHTVSQDALSRRYTPLASTPSHSLSARAAAARTPTPTCGNPAMQGLDAAAPSPRPRRLRAHPNARHATARPGPAHAAAPAAACARPAPHSPATKSMAHRGPFLTTVFTTAISPSLALQHLEKAHDPALFLGPCFGLVLTFNFR